MAGKQADIKVGVVTNYDDKGLKKAEQGLSGFKKSIDDASTVGGKFSAGWSNVKDQVVGNAGLLAAGAGVALAGFAIKAVGAFTQTAKAAIDLSTSTGLAVEDASRWIAVGDDYQVGADALATGLGKIAKTLDDTKWAKYGIATRDAGGQARDTNDILLDTFDKLSAVKNETERARIGQELFGKGYQSLTPILGHTRAEYEKMLSTVEHGQVITAKEAKSAEAMRLAQDDLHDAVQEVTLAVGQLAAQGAPAVSFFAKVILKTLEWRDALADIDAHFGGSGIFTSAPGLIGKVADAATDAKDRFVEMKKYGPFSTEEQQKAQDYAEHMKNYVTPAIDDLDRAHKDLASGGLAAVTSAEEDAQKKADDLATAMDEAKRHAKSMTDDIKRGLDEVQSSWDTLSGQISSDKSWINLQQTFDDAKAKGVEAMNAVAQGTDDATQKTRDYQLSVLDTKQGIIDFASEVLKVPKDVQVKVEAFVNADELQHAVDLLQILKRNADVSASIVVHSGAGYEDDSKPYASGTSNATPGVHLVGEQGPELVAFGGGESVATASQTAAMMGVGGNTYQIQLVMPVIASQADYYRAGQQLTAALAEYERRRGF